MEMELLHKKNKTLAKYDKAISSLNNRSEQLYKAVEPRNAYTVKTRDAKTELGGSPSQQELNDLKRQL